MLTILWILLGMCGFLVLFAFLASFFFTCRHTQKVFRSPAEYQLPFEKIEFTTSDQICLRGWWIPAKDSSRTIIMLHGRAGTMDPDIQYAPCLHSAGFNVLMFDFRAHGRSDGTVSTVGFLEVRDVLAAINVSSGRGSQKVGLLGFSMGGRVAILSAPKDDRIKAIISDGGPVSMTTAISQELLQKGIPLPVGKFFAGLVIFGASLRTGVNLFRNEPIRKVRDLPPKPVLFIHGGQDPYTLSGEIEQMVNSAGENAQLWVVPEAGHRDVDVHQPAEYQSRVLTFLNKHLK